MEHRHHFVIQQRGTKIVKRCLDCKHRVIIAEQPKKVVA